MIRYLFLAVFLLSFFNTSAFRRHGIYAGIGVGSSEQFRNVSSDYTGDRTRMGLPLEMTGALFATYRYRVNDAFTAGITGGFDNSHGRVTSRRNYFGSGRGSDLPGGMLGAYGRRSRTIAAEVTITYYSGKEGTFYGALGGGYTFSTVTINYDDDIYKKYSDKLGADPLVINDSRGAHQVTFFGYRTADPLAFFIEAGFGYKGLVNLGMSYDFGRP
jgi:hypothetical protein